MKAVVLTRFGPPEVLQLQDIADPTPGEHEVLIRVRATTASAGDCELRGLKLPLPFRLAFRIYAGLHPEKLILGQEIAGDIKAVGSAVTRFREGDAVFGWTGFGLGGYAEYTCLRETAVLASKPANLTYEEAAPLVVGGLEAAYFLRRAHVESGERILIVGAGGSIGTFAVQMARSLGAQVTAVDRAGKLQMLRSIGADRVIDMRDDFLERGETYDILFDIPGKVAFPRGVKRLAPGGRFLLANPPVSQMIFGGRTAGKNGPQVIRWRSRTRAEYADDLRFLNDLVEAGRVRSVIDRTYPLEKAAEAHEYVDSGEKKGSVVLQVNPGSSLDP